MNDLISRQAAIDALNGEIEITGRTNAEAVKGYVRLVKDRLERLPSAQPERKKGRWIGGEIGRCSVCGHEGCASDIWNNCERKFCPNCGAEMKGGRE